MVFLQRKSFTMHILVVDDLQTDRFVIKKILQPDFNVMTLSSATEARAYARSHSFDVALINVMLRNDLDGIDLLHDLRRLNPHRFEAIAITCHVDDNRYARLLQSGFRSVMNKPFDRPRFETILAHLSASRAA